MLFLEERCDGFQCANKQCIHLENVCDGKNDCEDKSDEGGKCGKLKLLFS